MSSMLQSDCILKVKTTMLYLQKGGSKVISLNPLIFWAMLPIWSFMLSPAYLVAEIWDKNMQTINNALFPALYVLFYSYVFSYFIYKWYELYKQKNIVGFKKLIIAFIISAIIIALYFLIINKFFKNLTNTYTNVNNQLMESVILLTWRLISGFIHLLTFFMPYVYLGYTTRQENEFIKTKINTKYFLHRWLYVCFVLFCLGFSIVFYGSSFVDLNNSNTATLNISKSIPYRLDYALYFLLWLLHEFYLQLKKLS